MSLVSWFIRILISMTVLAASTLAYGQIRCEALFVPAAGPLSQNETKLRGLEKLSKNLGHEVIIKKLPALNLISLIDSSTGKTMGGMEIVIHQQVLVIMGLEVAPGYRGKGVSEALLEVALQGSAQPIEMISTTILTQDNAVVLNTQRQLGLTLEQAIRKTPAYLIRAKFGFTELVPGSITENSFNARRPSH